MVINIKIYIYSQLNEAAIVVTEAIAAIPNPIAPAQLGPLLTIPQFTFTVAEGPQVPSSRYPAVPAGIYFAVADVDGIQILLILVPAP